MARIRIRKDDNGRAYHGRYSLGGVRIEGDTEVEVSDPKLIAAAQAALGLVVDGADEAVATATAEAEATVDEAVSTAEEVAETASEAEVTSSVEAEVSVDVGSDDE